MATKHTRVNADGTTTWRIGWRQYDNGVASQPSQPFNSAVNTETDADVFKLRVEEAGNRWPDGWDKEYGWETPPDDAEETRRKRKKSKSFYEMGQKVIWKSGAGPYEKSKMRTRLNILKDFEAKDHTGTRLYKPFDQDVHEIIEDDIIAWKNSFPNSLSTLAKYHDIISAIFRLSIEEKLISDNPAKKTRPLKKKIKSRKRKKTFLTEIEFQWLKETFRHTVHQQFVTVLVGTGLRWSEATCLWVRDWDSKNKTIKVWKAWKQEGTDGERPLPQDIPEEIQEAVKPKHDALSGWYIGEPKTAAGYRDFQVSDEVAEIFDELCAGKEHDDFIFVTPARAANNSEAKFWSGGFPMRESTFMNNQWNKGIERLKKAHPEFHKNPTPHDLRHTCASWALANNTPIKALQYVLGHDSAQMTLDEYGKLMPQSLDAFREAMSVGLRGHQINTDYEIPDEDVEEEEEAA